MPEDVVAHGIMTLTADAPFGENTIQFILEGKLYEAECSHFPQEKEGEWDPYYRWLQIKVKRIG